MDSDPPSTSIDKRSSLLTHPKPPLGLKHIQPRKAGFNPRYKWLDEILEPRRLNRQICEELFKGPPSGTQDDRSPSEHRKHSIKTVFSSRSKRKSLKESDKMPVATHRTPEGRKYRQILSEQVYDNSSNASTYQVNRCRRPLALTTDATQQKQATASDKAGGVAPSIYEINGIKQQPVSERSAHSNLGNGEAAHRLSPFPTAGTPNPTSGSLGNRFLADRLVEGSIAARQNEETMASLTKRSTAEDSLGLLRDLSQILSRGETASLTAGTSQVTIPEAELQPRVRDFAADGSAPSSHALAAIQRRSRSPAKRRGKQTEAPVTPDRSLDGATCGGQPASQLCRSPNSIILPPGASQDAARPLEPLSPMTQGQVLGIKVSPVINCHSKAPSVVSAASTAEDIQSDASSGVVTNARSAVFVKMPPQPGPAPLTPLPSLPEGPNNFAPATPRASQSSRRLTSPESSPSKVAPHKSPTRSQYRLYPSVDSSPPKRRGSVTMANAATGPEQVMPRLSPPLRSKRRGFSCPRSECLPTSMSVGRLDELEQRKKDRVDKTRQQKLRDLARIRSHKAIIAEVEPVTRDTENGFIYNQGVYNLATSPSKHRQQGSQVSSMSASTTLQYRDSTKLSHKLSPIIVVAEQEPTFRSQRAPFPNSHMSSDGIDEQTRISKTVGPYPVLPRPTLQRPDDKNKVRPLSSHSLPVPCPVASQVATPHLSPFLQGPSHHSLYPPSTHEVSGLEARLSAMERKNAMLERAFLAVLNTSATFSVSLGRNGTEDAWGNTSSGLSDRDGDRFGGTSGTDTLDVRLEKVMALHSGSASSRWSTSSGP